MEFAPVTDQAHEVLEPDARPYSTEAVFHDRNIDEDVGLERVGLEVRL